MVLAGNCCGLRIRLIWLHIKQESPPAWTQEAYRPPCSKSLAGGGGGYLPWGTPPLLCPDLAEGYLPWPGVPTLEYCSPPWPGRGGGVTYLGVPPSPILTWLAGTYLGVPPSPILTWQGVPTLGYPSPILTWLGGGYLPWLGVPTLGYPSPILTWSGGYLPPLSWPG